ncbi:hypothetical protein OQA88_5494 [Cercophora sp. LCS_1]
MHSTILTSPILTLIPLATHVPAHPKPPLNLPTRTIAGVSLPDTPLIRSAHTLLQQHSNPTLYRHVMRSWLLGSLMLHHNSTPSSQIDPEVHAVSILLHDLGLGDTPGSPVVSPDRRFEVDGAIAARDFITTRSIGPKRWDEHKVQLMWDAIALHTQLSVAVYKEPVVDAVARGISLDFSGPGLGVTEEEYKKVVEEFPRDGFKTSVVETVSRLCRDKAGTTYDTWMQPFGEKFVEGYSAVGKRTIDGVLGLPDE